MLPATVRIVDTDHFSMQETLAPFVLRISTQNPCQLPACACRDTSVNEAVALLGSDTWSLHYCCHHPLVATAAAAVSLDHQKQHLQQLPWKKVLPVAAACGVSLLAKAAGCSNMSCNQAKSSPDPTTSPARGSTGASSGSSTGSEAKPATALWWEVSDGLCDLCGVACDGDQVQLCEMCGLAQYCSTNCHKGAVEAGKHTWAACRALARVKAGKWKGL